MNSIDYSTCRLCPRHCGKNRVSSVGYCGVGAELKIARAGLHFYEEPCISGKNGSGTIFFSGCPLGCIFCQNREISTRAYGKEISIERLREICFELKASGAENINLVTPMHFAPQIKEALMPIKKTLALPIIVNTGGYDSPKQLSFFDGLADIYLPDFKFYTEETGKEFANAPDYPKIAEAALHEMFRQVGRPIFNECGMLQKGMIVRHLILPGKRKESIDVVEKLAEIFKKEDILLSLMSQYTPLPNSQGSLARTITTFEAQTVQKAVERIGFEGYFQERSSAKEKYTPLFDLTGV